MAQSVLVTAMSLDYGGAETHVVDLATELCRRGWHVVVASQGGRLVPRLPAGVSHFYSPLHSRSPLDILSAIRILGALVEKEGVRLLHAHGRIPAWVCSHLQGVSPRLPLVTTYHGVYAAGFPWRLVTRQGDLSIAVSDDVKNHFVSKLGFDPMRVRVIPNGIDTTRFAPGPYPALRAEIAGREPPRREPPRCEPSGQEALGAERAQVVANISRMDGPFADTALALVAALPALHAQSPGIVALLVGDGDRFGDVKSACDAANRAMGRRAAVAVGGQEDVVPYLLSSDVVVAVARAALEAMSCGKPVVFAGEGGFRGPIGEGALDALRRSNFTARGSGEPTTPQALAQAVATFLSDPSRARAAGDLGRQIVSSEYSWDVLVKRTLEVYEAAQDMHVMGEGRDGRV